MAEDIYCVRGDVGGADATGVSLTTTPAVIAFPFGTRYVRLAGRAYATGVVAQVKPCPWIHVLKSTDNGATATDASEAVQDSTASTTLGLGGFPSGASGGRLYIGSHAEFRGLAVSIGTANTAAGSLTAEYWDGSAWTALAGLTDGTVSAGVPLAQSGRITWTVPSGWVQVPGVQAFGAQAPGSGNRCFWVRLSWSATLSANTSIAQMLAMPSLTNYFEVPENQPVEWGIHAGPLGTAGIEARMDAGTGQLVVGFSSPGKLRL